MIQHHKERGFISKKMKEYKKQKNIEAEVFALSLFCERKLHKENKEIYYSKLDKKLTKYLDLDKSFQYHKFTKDKDFITKHIEKTERFRETYIRVLKIKLDDKSNNNFKITNEEIKKLMNHGEIKKVLKRGRWNK